MKKCGKCGQRQFNALGVNYCIYCGGEMIEERVKYYCGNESCRVHIKKIDFPKHAKYCGECRAPIIAVEEDI